MTTPHQLEVRVYYEDTDAAGIVYHASYLKFAERGRTELLRRLGFDHANLARQHGVVFAVTRCVADFVRPARLDDLLVVGTSVAAIGGARVEMAQLVQRGDDAIARLAVTLAVLDATSMRPARLPSALRAAFMATGGGGGGAEPAPLSPGRRHS